MIHLALHFIIPAIVVVLLYRHKWASVYLLLMSTMLVDLDHLLANPIYDAARCSIGFHPLHELWFVALYFILCFIPRVRVIGIGLIIHMALDSIDCQLTNGLWLSGLS